MIPSKLKVPLVTKSALNGIIYKLKNEFNVNPIDDFYVVPTASSVNSGFDVKTIVSWDAAAFQTSPGSESNLPWIQLNFPRSYIFPTAYSIKGTYETNSEKMFASEWEVYGIKDGDENKEHNWQLLATNKSSETSFCRTLYNVCGCRDASVGTYTLESKKTNKGFKRLRWKLKTPSCNNGYYFAASAIDVYGTLSSNPLLSCYCRCSMYRFQVAVLLSNMMIS